MARWTKTQRCILDVLSDGLPHVRRDLVACLPDDMGPASNIHFHLCQLRKRLRPAGQDIVAVLRHRKIYYQHVRLLLPLPEGKN